MHIWSVPNSCVTAAVLGGQIWPVALCFLCSDLWPLVYVIRVTLVLVAVQIPSQVGSWSERGPAFDGTRVAQSLSPVESELFIVPVGSFTTLEARVWLPREFLSLTFTPQAPIAGNFHFLLYLVDEKLLVQVDLLNSR